MTTYRFPWPPVPLQDKQTQSGEIILSDIGRRLAGNQAALEGHIMGGDSVGDGENTAPINPSGRKGHDHSGGIYGRKINRSVLTDCAATFAEIAGGNVARAQAWYSDSHALDGANVTTIGSRSHSYFVWVPHCSPDGAWATMTVELRLDYSGSNMKSDDVITITATNATYSAVFGGGANHTGSDTVDTPQTAQVDKKIVIADLGFVPGEWNQLFLSSTYARSATAGARSAGWTYTQFEAS